jgi:tetratricopeptide (TPR) repeat protein
MWEESIKSNLRSNEVAADYARKVNLDGTMAGVPHAYDFMAYAHLQLGQDTKAKALIDESAAVKKIIGARLAGATGQAAVAARYMLERQDWRGAAQLTPFGTDIAPAEAITHFARAMGAARSGDLNAAERDIQKLEELRTGLEKANQSYWAGQVEIQRLAAKGWLAQAQDKKDEALKLMRAAADVEDASEKHVAMENRLYPMRELLGDMLMAQGQPGEALAEYGASMKNSRERLRGYYGAAKAAEAAGDHQQAAKHYGALARLTKDADTERPEIREAREKLPAR